MSPIVKELRNNAKCAPFWRPILEAAADEIERLQGKNEVLSQVQDIFSEAKEVDHALSDDELNKIKADAVREAAEALYSLNVSAGHGDENEFAIKYFQTYASKLERG